MFALCDRSLAMEAILADEEMHGGEECLRCGSLLPAEDEGICPTCGTDFGRATIAMPALKKPLNPAAAAAPTASALDKALGPDVVPQENPSLLIAQAQPATGPSTGLKVALVVLVVAILGVIALLVVLLTGGEDVPAPSAPAPAEAPAKAPDAPKSAAEAPVEAAEAPAEEPEADTEAPVEAAEPLADDSEAPAEEPGAPTE